MLLIFGVTTDPRTEFDAVPGAVEILRSYLCFYSSVLISFLVMNTSSYDLLNILFFLLLKTLFFFIVTRSWSAKYLWEALPLHSLGGIIVVAGLIVSAVVNPVFLLDLIGGIIFTSKNCFY